MPEAAQIAYLGTLMDEADHVEPIPARIAALWSAGQADALGGCDEPGDGAHPGAPQKADGQAGD